MIQSRNKNYHGLLLSYTIIWSLVSLFSFFCFHLYGKAFMRYDGITQHCTALAYWGEYLREIFINISHGNFILKQWDFNIGLGADVFTTLHYYVIGEPINLLSVFIYPEHTEYLYTILIFIRLFLVGLSFIVFSKHHNHSNYSILCGSLIYVFCGYTLFCAPRHPYFCTPMIWLPLLCLGIDYILEKQSFHIFTVSVFLSCISNFYFFYMLTIIVFIYALIRFLFLYENAKNRTNVFLSIFLKTLLHYLIAICLAAPIFFPNIYGFLSCSRTSSTQEIPLLYDISYYVKLILGFESPKLIYSYTFLGFAAPVFPIVISLFFLKDKPSTQYKIFLSISIVLLSFPIFAHIFNGFNYLTNRWCFSLSFLIASISTFAIPKFLDYQRWKKKQKILILGISLCYSSFIILLSFIAPEIKQNYFLSNLVLFIFIILCITFFKFKLNLKYLLLPMICLSCIINANIRYSKLGFNYLNDFFNKNDFSNLVKNSPYKEIPSSTNTNFFRVDYDNISLKNIPLLFKINGCSYYWSENSKYLYQFYKKNNLTSGESLSLNGFCNRNDLKKLFSVKYVIDGKGNVFENNEAYSFLRTVNNVEVDYLLSTNKVSSNTNFTESTDIVYSIPYSKNWVLYIDGKKYHTEIFKDILIKATIPQGEHNIELIYKTPFLIPGIIISLFAAFLYIILIINKDIK